MRDQENRRGKGVITVRFSCFNVDNKNERNAWIFDYKTSVVLWDVIDSLVSLGVSAAPLL